MDRKTLAAELKNLRKMQADVSKGLTAIQNGAFDYVGKKGITEYYYDEGLDALADAMKGSSSTLKQIRFVDQEFARIYSEAQTRTGTNK